MIDKMKFAVDVPPANIDKFGDNEWINVKYFETREEALDFVQEYYGADEEGKVCLINSL